MRISPQWLSERRLDCYFYQQEFIDHVKQVAAIFPSRFEAGTMFNILDGTHDSVATKNIPEGVYDIPFLRSQDIQSGYLKDDFGAFLNRKDHAEKCKRSQIHHYDLLLNIMASTGSACVYSPFYPHEANANRAVGVLRSKSSSRDLDFIYFLSAWFSSRVGGRELGRNLKGSIQQRLNLEDISECILPGVKNPLAKYIGNKVRQAERLRMQARVLEGEFTHAMQLQCPEVFGKPKAFGRSCFVNVAFLRRDLNPGAFNPERLRIRAEIKKSKGRELREFATIDAAVTNSFSKDCDYIGLDSISSSSSQLDPDNVAQAEIGGTARILREGPVISKLRPYLNKVSYIPDELASAVGSTELICIRPKLGVSGWFIYGVLKLQCTVSQLQPLAKGSTHPRIDAGDVLDLMVLWHENSKQLGQNLAQAQAMYFASEKLTTAAKGLIEALIEGKISETELVGAQEFLEREDNFADRALLSRLTRQGIDVPGQPPLFPDLDALYALLAQTQEEPA